jgi:hypothetical protein
LIYDGDGVHYAEFFTFAAANAVLGDDPARSARDEPTLFHDDGFARAVEHAGSTGSADGRFDMSDFFCFRTFFRRGIAVRVENGASGTGFEACAAFRAEKSVDMVLLLAFPGNGALRTFFCASAAADAI